MTGRREAKGAAQLGAHAMQKEEIKHAVVVLGMQGPLLATDFTSATLAGFINHCSERECASLYTRSVSVSTLQVLLCKILLFESNCTYFLGLCNYISVCFTDNHHGTINHPM